MKKFKDYEDLKKYINPDNFTSYNVYLENELSVFLGSVGSNNGYFDVEIDNKKYNISVYSEEIEENLFGYTYELEEL